MDVSYESGRIHVRGVHTRTDLPTDLIFEKELREALKDTEQFVQVDMSGGSCMADLISGKSKVLDTYLDGFS